ncbi:hypothetical protein RND71_022096 [Anisodus tanguticus]|uniref:Di19 C-terminal domain-containing protein n=1 Tax=Anisodus tanguticus TaxID=243964 RepID=A0AAE1RZD9_9SOLA|nr:hypothetical protein RND71_022096 [Anisodus tanguticus]
MNLFRSRFTKYNPKDDSMRYLDVTNFAPFQIFLLRILVEFIRSNIAVMFSVECEYFKGAAQEKISKSWYFGSLYIKKRTKGREFASILGGSSRLVSSSGTDPDTLLFSFINNIPLANEILDVQPLSSTKQSFKKESTLENSFERNEQSPLSDKDQEEKARKSKFVQGRLLSTFLEEDF